MPTMICLRPYHLSLLSILLAGCAGTSHAPVTASSSAAPTKAQVAFSDDLQDLPDRTAVEALLLSNESMNENTIRRKNYVSAAGQNCSMLEVASQESSLVACKDNQGIWNVRRAYGDMDLSANLPPAPIADEQPMLAAIMEEPILQQSAAPDATITAHTIRNAVIGEIPPLSETNMAIAQGVSDEEAAAYETSMQEMAAHMNIETRDAATAPIPNLVQQTTERIDARWTERRSSAVTLVADRPRSTLGGQPRRSFVSSERRL